MGSLVFFYCPFALLRVSQFTVVYDACVLYPAPLSADTIVTFNLKDFPEEALKPYGGGQSLSQPPSHCAYEP